MFLPAVQCSQRVCGREAVLPAAGAHTALPGAHRGVLRVAEGAPPAPVPRKLLMRCLAAACRRRSRGGPGTAPSRPRLTSMFIYVLYVSPASTKNEPCMSCCAGEGRRQAAVLRSPGELGGRRGGDTGHGGALGRVGWVSKQTHASAGLHVGSVWAQAWRLAGLQRGTVCGSKTASAASFDILSVVPAGPRAPCTPTQS